MPPPPDKTMIFYDPTEGRSSSVIPEIKGLATEAKGLEAATGADIAITRNDASLSALAHPKADEIGRLLYANLSNSEVAESAGATLPSVIGIKKAWIALQDSILVQRKSGGDLISSVPHLDIVLARMLIWTRQPWLLAIGVYGCSQAGMTIVNGRNTDFSYSAMQGALDAWQERGGYVGVIERNAILPEWLARKEKRLLEKKDEKIVIKRQKIQTLIMDDPDSWIETLMSFPGIGSETARAIVDEFPTLALALMFMSDPDAQKYPNKPSGFGVITGIRARNRLGLLDKQRLVIETAENKDA